MEFNLENMCRTCLNEDGMMYSVFSNENQIQRNQSYADMLMACASVQVDAEDGLPQFICEQCMKQLIVAFCFKEQSEQSYATLREITKNPSIEFIKEEAPDVYSDITDLIQVDFDHKIAVEQIPDNTSQKGAGGGGGGKVTIRMTSGNNTESEDFKLSKEFLNDDIVLDFDMDVDEKCHVTRLITTTTTAAAAAAGDISNEYIGVDDVDINGDDGGGGETDDDDLFKPDVKPLYKRNCPQFKRIKLPGRVLSNSNNNNKKKKNNTNDSKRDTVTPLLVCPYCEHKFKDKQEFRKHKRTHILSYRCELCDKQFRSSHGLAYHTKIHQGIKNFVCPFENCKRRFTLKQALQKHLSVHTQEKNHLCSLCGKAYGTYDALHYHLRTHKGERPYLCMHCGKTFKQSCHLKSHMWVHNGIKPHVCVTCGKCYTSGHQLKKHLKKYCNNNKNNTTATSSSTANTTLLDDNVISVKLEDQQQQQQSITTITVTDPELFAIITN